MSHGIPEKTVQLFKSHGMTLDTLVRKYEGRDRRYLKFDSAILRQIGNPGTPLLRCDLLRSADIREGLIRVKSYQMSVPKVKQCMERIGLFHEIHCHTFHGRKMLLWVVRGYNDCYGGMPPRSLHREYLRQYDRWNPSWL